MSKALSTSLAALTSLPSSNIRPSDIATGTEYLKRLQLVTKGKLVDQGLVKPGHYAIPISDSEATDLGDSVDILVLAVRNKALDTNENPPVASYDAESDLYKQIVEAASQKDSGCMWGCSFLVYERTSGQFLEFFMGNASGRQEAGKLATFLPVSEEQAKAYGKGFKAQPPQVSTLTAKYVKRPKYAWHAPQAGKCSTPIEDLPPVEVIVKKVTDFLNPKNEEPEVVAESKRSR